MADILTNSGEAHVVDKLDDIGASDEYIGQGTDGASGVDKTDTDLNTPSNESRVIAVRTQPSADVIQEVATITATGTRAITECGLFDAAGTGNPPSGGNLLSHHTFTVINVVTDDQIEFTIQWEIT